MEIDEDLAPELGQDRLISLPPEIDPELVAQTALSQNLGEFFVSPSFTSPYVSALIRAGFLPMSADWGEGAFLLPKLHRQRSLLDWADIHTPRSVRRLARGFCLRVNADFGACQAACAGQHGEDWLSPALQEIFLSLHLKPVDPEIGLHSIELYPDPVHSPKLDPDFLCAGEIGYSCGGAYTSLSGFYRIDSGGSVQLAATGALLASSGFSFWDLGMPMAYKSALGARNLDRSQFLERWRQARNLRPARLKSKVSRNARELIDSR